MNMPLPFRIKEFLFALLAILVICFLLESLARIGQTIRHDIIRITTRKSNTWYVYSPDLGWERRPDFRGIVNGFDRQFDSEGFNTVDTSQKYDASKPKVLFLGDSTTFGIFVPTTSTFVELTDAWLPNVNVINLGTNGYTSHQGYKAFLKYGLKLRPDIVIVSFNFNDRRYVLPPAGTDSDATFQHIYDQYKESETAARSKHLLEALYLYRAIRYILKLSGLVADNSHNTYLQKEIHLKTLRPRVHPENYRRNLTKIVHLARRNDAVVLFMILKDNPLQTEYLRKGIAFLQKSQYDQAIEHLTVAMQKAMFNNNVMPNAFAVLARIYLAEAYRRQGLDNRANIVSILARPYASLHGGQPMYLDTKYNRIMREIADVYKVEIVDAGRVLDEYPSDYIDYCHPDSNGHKRIAKLLYERISEILSKKGGAS